MLLVVLLKKQLCSNQNDRNSSYCWKQHGVLVAMGKPPRREARVVSNNDDGRSAEV